MTRTQEAVVAFVILFLAAAICAVCVVGQHQ